MLRKIRKKIERWLYRKGYHVPDVRMLAVNQICIMLCVLPLVVLPWGWPIAVGAVLGTVNFLALGRVIQELVFLPKGAVALQMFSFYARLILTAGVLYYVIVYQHASVGWLLAGLSTVLINILLWGISHLLGKTSKEA